MQRLVPDYTGSKYLSGNALVCADNIDVLRELPDASVDLIYLDPPFQSDSHYVAVFGDKDQVDEQLRDIWKWTTETERTFQHLPYGSLLDTLKGIRMIAGQTSPMAAYCVHGASASGDAPGLETHRKMLTRGGTGRSYRRSTPQVAGGRHPNVDAGTGLEEDICLKKRAR